MMRFLLALASLVAVICLSHAGKCNVRSLQIHNESLAKYDGLEVFGSNIHASCGNDADRIKLLLTDIDPMVERMSMRIPYAKGRFRFGERYSMVGNHFLNWPQQVKVHMFSGGKVFDEMHFTRQYKDGKQYDPRQMMEEKNRGFFTFEMKKERMRYSSQPLMSIDVDGGSAYTLFAFARKNVIENRNVRVLANVYCDDTGEESLDMDVEMDGVQYGRLMSSYHQMRMQPCNHNKFECVWKAEYFKNVDSTKEIGKKFRQCFK